ncbi:PREDICTED: ubiquitin carboxyl-terminal hydrolase 17-like [Nelumbo nucifera]|uniref:ubiquitinyl hydrolase 1 n=1 Tax=Nelumbo nucifera TaxID=4432 RepID=A0A1U8ASN3_NELNU|nr:PREDICTED: ubiquitin carboxyl-terminal hydrolase 17-like [Nelumbo nucifera]
MLVPGDLGFSYLVLLFFFFTPIFGFVIRRKWRIAVARQEEIRRLMELASEQEERAALEAAVEYGAISVSARQSLCAVCYCPTTTRCAQCKAVRYCSGKCQIIHWRQGHKDECQLLYATHQFSDKGGDSDSGQKVVLQGEQHEICHDDTGKEGICNAQPVKMSPEKPTSSKFGSFSEVRCEKHDDKVEPLVNTKRMDAISESSTSLLDGFSASTGVDKSSVDVSAGKIPNSISPDRSEVLQPDDTTAAETTTDVNDRKLIESRSSEFNNLVDSLNSFSCSSKLKQREPSCSDGEVHSTSTCPSGPSSTDSSGSSINGSDESTTSESSTASSDFWEGTVESSGSSYDVCDNSAHSRDTEGGDSISSGSDYPLKFSVKNLRHTIPSSLSQFSKPKDGVASQTGLGNGIPACGDSLAEKIVTDVSGNSIPKTLIHERSESMVNARGKDSQVLKSVDNGSYLPYSKTGGLSMKSTKVDGIHTARTALSEVSRSSNANNGLKTSVQKVVQQFRASKILISNPLGTEKGGKYNCKMIFPYEQFVKLYHDKMELQPFGLKNCGNSCYANAVLQCLAFTRPLTSYLLQGLHSKTCPKKEWCFTCEFEDLIMKARERKSQLSPIRILSQLQNIGSHLGQGREEDAHEFLRYSIDAMQSVFLKEAGSNVEGPYAEETTLMSLIFGGYLRSKIKCMKCQGKSERNERMMDLTVEIDGDIGTLEEALKKFTATEILDGENKYQCERCKSYEKAKKKLTVSEAPNVLTIALKRFQSGKFGKLNKVVRFPRVLDLAPYMSTTNDKSPVYTLYAVVVHLDVMNAAFSGHYVCYIKNFQEKWYKIDDSTVEPVELEKVLSKGAYMLLYARCSPRAPSWVRNSMSHDGKIRRSRFSEAISSNHGGRSATCNSRPNVAPNGSPSGAHWKPEDYPYRITLNGSVNYESFDSDDGRFHHLSSDNSSLFSCSDEASCSTESTRDSTSTEDFSDYFFGDACREWSSPLRVSSDSDGSSSPLCSRFSPLSVSKRHSLNSPETSEYRTCNTGSVLDADEARIRQSEESSTAENPPLQNSITTKPCRKSTTRSNSSNNLDSCSCRETDRKRFGLANPFGSKYGISLRRSTRERTTQTFY